MSKKVKILISALVATLLLTIGSVTTVMAEGEEETTPPPEATANGLLKRVAGILGIDEEDLSNAFEQAQQEICEDAFINRLNQAVKEERITQDQADDILEWWGQRPDDAIEAWQGQGPNATGRGMFRHTLRFRAMPRFHMQNGHGEGFRPRLPEETE